MSQHDTGASAPQIISPVEPQNFPLAIVAGLVTAAVGALIWATVVALTQYTLGLIAILIGYLVGLAIQKVGKGHDAKYSVVGAVCALLGCVAGNVLGVIVLVASAKGYTAAEMLSILDFDRIVQIATDVDIMTVVIYGIAVYEGWRFSVVKDVAAAPAQ